MRETQRHKDAFEYWLSLGGQTSDKCVRRVSEECQVSDRTIWRWYNEFNWANRRDIRLNARAKKIEEKTDNTIIDRKAKELADLDDIDKIAIAMIKETVYKDDDGKAYVRIKIEDARDMASMMNTSKELKKFKQLLIGEETERSNDKEIYIVAENGVQEKLKP